MATSWIRREFASPGLTQHPVGRELAAVQAVMSGSVVLCIDVSSSMSVGGRLPQAVKGAKRFVGEAVEAGYEVGLVLWNSGVHRSVALSRDPANVLSTLGAASAQGGTDVVPALGVSDQMLSGRSGDLVVAIFGDGDLGDRRGAIAKAAKMRARNIRILTCGLDGASAESLGEISSEQHERPRSAADGDVAGAVAGLASGLRKR